MARKLNSKPIQQRRTPRPHFTFIVDVEEITLMQFLVEYALKDRSRTTIKQLLHDRFISVNEEPTTQFDTPLHQGDSVVLHPAPLPERLHHPQVDILWQDDDLILVHKAAGIPTVASGQERDKTLMQILSAHLKKFNPRSKVYLLNRIDKDCAGFVLMTKSEQLQAEMTENWDKYVKAQTFAVAIEGIMPEAEGYLAPPTPEDSSKERKKNGGSPQRKGAEASEATGLAYYRVITQTESASLLVIDLKSGRNNRLRKQFAALRRPIIGDWRNGSGRKDLGRVALETITFSFVHPKTGKQYNFDQSIPAELRKWVKSTTKTKLQDE